MDCWVWQRQIKGKLCGNEKEMELEITWKDSMRPQFIPFVDDQGHQGMRVVIEHK